jgi:hypothetical protein
VENLRNATQHTKLSQQHVEYQMLDHLSKNFLTSIFAVIPNGRMAKQRREETDRSRVTLEAITSRKLRRPIAAYVKIYGYYEVSAPSVGGGGQLCIMLGSDAKNADGAHPVSLYASLASACTARGFGAEQDEAFNYAMYRGGSMGVRRSSTTHRS